MAHAEKLQQSSFWAVTIEEAQQLRKWKLIDAPMYLLSIVKAHGAAGWKWAVDVKAFCEEWGFKERTFYRALSTLRSLNLISWKKRDKNVISWCPVDLDDSPEAQNPDSSMAPPPVTVNMSQITLPLPAITMTLPAVTLPLPQVAASLPLITVQLPNMAEQKPETLDIQGSSESTNSIPDLAQKNFKSPTTTTPDEKGTGTVVVDVKNSFCEEKDKDWLTGIKARLREIRIAPDNVKWTFSQFPKNVIEDAIAYTGEQKWASKPAAVYVKACRDEQKPEGKSACEDQYSAPPEPDESTLNWLKELRDKRIIKDYYLCPWNNSRYRALFVDTGASMQPWWKVVETFKKEELTKT